MRAEVLRLPHWSLAEMRAAFGWSLDQYLFHGGYPGAAALIAEPARWARYILDALVETTIARDVLLLSRVDKPALLRRLFHLGCSHSGQILSYTKMLGQLQDAGNTTTLAHYLDLLAAAGMLTGLQKYAGAAVRQRGSVPKLQVLNTALMTAHTGLTLQQARADREFRGRLVESAVGAHLANAAAVGTCVSVQVAAAIVIAIEVKPSTAKLPLTEPWRAKLELPQPEVVEVGSEPRPQLALEGRRRRSLGRASAAAQPLRLLSEDPDSSDRYGLREGANARSLIAAGRGCRLLALLQSVRRNR